MSSVPDPIAARPQQPEKASAPTPGAAFDNLAMLARTGAPGLAQATLKVQTELFLQHADTGEADSEAFLALALTLLPMVDDTTAREIATKLAVHPLAPQPMIEALAARGGGVAEIVLARAGSLPDSLRRMALQHEDPRLPAAYAARADISEADQLHLLGRGEPALLLALARNRAIRLARPLGAGLAAAARHDRALAEALFARGDIDAAMLAPLYLAGNRDQRAALRDELGRRIRERGIALPGRMASEAEQARLMDRALDGMAALIAELALVAGRDAAMVQAAAADPSREIVALSLLALGTTPEDATRMLLRTGDAVAQNSAALHALVAVLRSTSRSAADIILGAMWSGQPARPAGQHVPVMAPGGTTSRGAAPAHAEVTTRLLERRHGGKP